MKRFVAVILLLLFALSIPAAIPTCGKSSIPKGAYGVFSLPSCKVTANLYTCDNSTRAAQRVVDKEDCALWRPYSKGHAILDHAYSIAGSGVWIVNEFKVGDYGTLQTAKGKFKFQCTAVYLAKMNKYVFKYGKETIAVKKGDLICACCADEDGLYYVAYFKRAK